MPTVEWDEIEPAVSEAFSVFIGQPELAWAKRAWDVLAEARLTKWDDEIEVPIIYLRALVLGGIFQDWCATACDEYPDHDYSVWASQLEFEAFSLGRLYGLWVDEVDKLEWLPEAEAFDALVETRRAEVVDAITSGFGGVAGLYESLWKVTIGEDSFGAFGSSMENMRSYLWVEDGCERVGPGI